MGTDCKSALSANGEYLYIRAIGVTSDHGRKEDPDDIKKNDGKGGYITTKDMNNRFKKAESAIETTVKGALQQRADYLKKEEEKKKNN
ncbi:hypothetical protein [Flavobacterium sp.]|uniref:hypothetical protein n=1 Tax=Flavobacterium sp. TaxID=239 RepID=UPI003795348B